MSEYKFVLFLVIAVIFFVIHMITSKPGEIRNEQFDGVGVISRINANDSGRTWYYVDININGNIFSAQTDTYNRVPDDVKKGDVVSVKYHFTQKGKVRCYITQSGFERIIQENADRKPVLLYAALVSFLLFLFMLVKTVFVR